MKIQVSRPVLTEKTLALAATGWYTFAVPVDMEKESIGKAINSLYNVTVMQVRTARQHGKVRRGGRRMLPVKRPGWKKAFVKLKSGQTIEAFTVPTQGEKTK